MSNRRLHHHPTTTSTSGTGFGGRSNDFSSRRVTFQQNNNNNDSEQTSYLHIANQTLVYGTRSNDASWLYNYLNSEERLHLESVLKQVFQYQVLTDWSCRRDLYHAALQVCTTLASDPQLACLYGSAHNRDSLLYNLVEFARLADVICNRLANDDSQDNNNMQDLLLATQALEVKDMAERVVVELEQQQQQQQRRGPYQQETISNPLNTTTAVTTAAATTASSSAPLPQQQQSQQAQATSLEDLYKNELGPLRFDIVDTLHHHAFDDYASPSMGMADSRRMFKELASYQTSLPVEHGSSIFVRTMNERLDIIRALVIGPENTPYANGCFVFDIMLPASYPSEPPKVHFCTTGGGQTRFNPNLYANGKVCMSLLGTWSGPGWIQGESTLLQVLISIQSLILVPDPYYNEPGWEVQRNTPQGRSGSETYNRQLRKHTLVLCIKDFLESLVLTNKRMSYPEFEPVLTKHFLLKKGVIESQVKDWARLDFSLLSTSRRVCHLLNLLSERNQPAPSRPFFGKEQQPVSQVASAAPRAAVGRNDSGRLIEHQRTVKYTVRVPFDVRPGEHFQVMVKGRMRTIRCPMDSGPGVKCEFYILENDDNDDNDHAVEENEAATNGQQEQKGYIVTVPHGVVPGERFNVWIEGQSHVITCPPNVGGGAKVKIFPPSLENSEHSSSNSQEDYQLDQNGRSEQESQTRHGGFDVKVPPGVRPGGRFLVDRHGQRLLVTCPPHGRPGEWVHYETNVTAIPITQEEQEHYEDDEEKEGVLEEEVLEETEQYQYRLQHQRDVTPVSIYYSITEDWARTLSPSDLKFYWNRIGGGNSGGLKDVPTSFYARKLVMHQGSSGGHRTGDLSLVPVQVAPLDSEVLTRDGHTMLSYKDIANAQTKSFHEKVQWFRSVCSQLRVDLTGGHMIINVRQGFLLMDSVKAVMTLSRHDLRKTWRFRHVGGEYLNSLQEFQWYQGVMKDLFDPDLGLWEYSNASDQLRMQIHPGSGDCCRDHLQYFRFCGRILGKALLEGRHIMTAPLDPYIYKHLLGWPLQFEDLQHVSAEHYQNLAEMDTWLKSGESIDALCLYFTTTQQVLGKTREVELVPGGSSRKVTNDNFQAYVEAGLKYRLVGSVKDQITELLLGFLDVIPEALLAVFDYKELEQLIQYKSRTGGE